MRVYLAGPPFEDEYRRDAERLLVPAGHEPVDPMRRDFRGRTEGNEEEIVSGDLADIDSCGAVLADFGEPDEGTSMEAWYARSRGIPVVVWSRGRRPHPWTVWVADSVHERLEDAVSALAAVSAERFSDELRRAAADLWRAQRDHPFVRGLADGTLPPQKFLHFLRQDYLFLHAYAATLEAAAARAPSEELAERFTRLAGGIVEGERALQRRLADEWGVGPGELDTQRPTPTTDAYTRSLLRAAEEGGYDELLAAILPCSWGYSELGQSLAQLPRSPEERYARWIDLYASAEFAQVSEWCRRAVDAAAEGGDAVRARMRDAFLESSRHELAFWEAAWREEQPG